MQKRILAAALAFLAVCAVSCGSSKSSDKPSQANTTVNDTTEINTEISEDLQDGSKPRLTTDPEKAKKSKKTSKTKATAPTVSLPAFEPKTTAPAPTEVDRMSRDANDGMMNMAARGYIEALVKNDVELMGSKTYPSKIIDAMKAKGDLSQQLIGDEEIEEGGRLASFNVDESVILTDEQLDDVESFYKDYFKMLDGGELDITVADGRELTVSVVAIMPSEKEELTEKLTVVKTEEEGYKILPLAVSELDVY
jgi:hypothetical protein